MADALFLFGEETFEELALDVSLLVGIESGPFVGVGCFTERGEVLS